VAYKTVNLKPAVYERLRMYQTGGKSLSDVLDELMDEVEPEQWYAQELRIARKRLLEMKTKGVGMTLEELDTRMERERSKIDSATSGTRPQTRTRSPRNRTGVRRARASTSVERT